jgi:hypothetical protein
MSKTITKELLKKSNVFQILCEYQQLNFSVLLRQLLIERNIGIPDLYKILNDREYYLSLESLYRYFNPSPKSNRFPPQEFVQVFATALQLNEGETKALITFWKHWKLIKSCRCS